MTDEQIVRALEIISTTCGRECVLRHLRELVKEMTEGKK